MYAWAYTSPPARLLVEQAPSLFQGVAAAFGGYEARLPQAVHAAAALRPSGDASVPGARSTSYAERLHHRARCRKCPSS